MSPVIFDMFIDPLIHELNYQPTLKIPKCLFFADDGLLLPTTLIDAQRQLTIAESWAKRNGMQYNIQKCGIICTGSYPTVGDHLLLLDGEIIPVVQIYKYLGFPVTTKGIDFERHIDIQITSASSFLKFVQIQCAEWSPYTRYIIYSTFLRPKLEYGAPLTFGFKQFIQSKTLLDSLQKLQDEIVCWIFNAGIKKIKALNGILGILTVDHRFSHLRCRFQLHLHQSAIVNPIRSLISLSNSCQYLSSLRTNTLFDEFMRSPLLPSTHHELKKSLSDFLLSRRSAILSQSSSVLVNYIPFTARSLSLIDKVLFSPIQFQRMFLSWRRGSLFLNSICLCKQRWHRGHINCLPPITLPTRFEISFKEVKCNFTKNFCEIDFLLNKQEWDLVWNILQHWSRILNLKNID